MNRQAQHRSRKRKIEELNKLQVKKNRLQDSNDNLRRIYLAKHKEHEFYKQ